MRKLLILCLILLTAASAFGQKKPPKPKDVVTVKVDLGKLDQNTDTNEFFGLKIEFPEGWVVGDNEPESALLGLIKPAIKAKESANQKVIDRLLEELTPLLGGYRFLSGTRPDNPSMRISAENLRLNPYVRSGKDYLDLGFKTLQMMKTVPRNHVYGAQNRKDQFGGCELSGDIHAAFQRSAFMLLFARASR